MISINTRNCTYRKKEMYYLGFGSYRIYHIFRKHIVSFELKYKHIIYKDYFGTKHFECVKKRMYKENAAELVLFTYYISYT